MKDFIKCKKCGKKIKNGKVDSNGFCPNCSNKEYCKVKSNRLLTFSVLLILFAVPISTYFILNTNKDSEIATSNSAENTTAIYSLADTGATLKDEPQPNISSNKENLQAEIDEPSNFNKTDFNYINDYTKTDDSTTSSTHYNFILDNYTADTNFNTITSHVTESPELKNNMISHSTEISNAANEQIAYNNSKIEESKKMQKELEELKKNYDNKIEELNNWYNSEYDVTYSKMIDAQDKYNEYGGYAKEEDVTAIQKQIASAGQYLSNQGLANTGYAEQYKKELQDKLKNMQKRLTYSNDYNEYYYYLNTTLPSIKNGKLSVIIQDYKSGIEDIKKKYES